MDVRYTWRGEEKRFDGSTVARLGDGKLIYLRICHHSDMIQLAGPVAVDAGKQVQVSLTLHEKAL